MCPFSKEESLVSASFPMGKGENIITELWKGGRSTDQCFSIQFFIEHQMYSQVSRFVGGQKVTDRRRKLAVSGRGSRYRPSQLFSAVWGNASLGFCSLGEATAGPPPPDGGCHHFLSHPSWRGCLLFMIIRLRSSLSLWAGIQKQISPSIFSSRVSSLQIHTCPFPIFIRQKPVSTDGP